MNFVFSCVNLCGDSSGADVEGYGERLGLDSKYREKPPDGLRREGS